MPRLIFASRWLQLPLYVGLIAAQGCTGEEVGHSTTTTKRTTDTPTERTTVTEVHEKDTTLTPR